MPHKHTRRKGGDEANFNLGPSTVAKPLSTFDSNAKSKKNAKSGPKPKEDGKKGYKYDDTPRAFSRLMQYQTSRKRPSSGLDDGNERRSSKKRKRNADTNDTNENGSSAPQSAQPELPKILPGERLGDFAARVNHALPVGGLARKGKMNVEGLKDRQTKTEKRLHKMYAAWREEEARRKEQEEERQEQEEEAEEEKETQFGGQSVRVPAGKKGKRKRLIGETGGDDDEDPWAQLKQKREKPKGLHDVVQAPPSFKAVPKEKFKVRNNAKVDVVDVPSAAGSLKRREELSAARREVIERYRGMMGRNS